MYYCQWPTLNKFDDLAKSFYFAMRLRDIVKVTNNTLVMNKVLSCSYVKICDMLCFHVLVVHNIAFIGYKHIYMFNAE